MKILKLYDKEYTSKDIKKVQSTVDTGADRPYEKLYVLVDELGFPLMPTFFVKVKSSGLPLTTVDTEISIDYFNFREVCK